MSMAEENTETETPRATSRKKGKWKKGGPGRPPKATRALVPRDLKLVTPEIDETPRARRDSAAQPAKSQLEAHVEKFAETYGGISEHVNELLTSNVTRMSATTLDVTQRIAILAEKLEREIEALSESV